MISNGKQIVVQKAGDEFIFTSRDRECKTEERYVINALSKSDTREIYEYLKNYFNK